MGDGSIKGDLCSCSMPSPGRKDFGGKGCDDNDFGGSFDAGVFTAHLLLSSGNVNFFKNTIVSMVLQ